MKSLFIVTIYNRHRQRYWRIAVSAPSIEGAEEKSKDWLNKDEVLSRISKVCSTNDDINMEI